MNKARLTFLVTLALGFQLFVCIGLSSTVMALYFRDTVLPGTSVQGVDIGGLKAAAAEQVLRKALPWPSPDSLLMLVDPEGQSTHIRYSDIDYRADYQATVQEALKQSRQAVAWHNMGTLFGAILKGRDLPLVKSFNQVAFSKILNQLADKYNVPARNAQFAFNGNNVILFADSKGRQLDIQGTIKQLWELPPDQHRLALQFKTVEPEIVISDFNGINTRLAIFVTQFDLSNKARSHNIELASKLINNLIVPPNQVFSLNKVLGPRSQDRGYLQAPVIINNKLTTDYGGGVCQVATTLYNAVALAGLKIVERVPHSRPVPYAPAGKDATIAGDAIDFKFLNNTDYPILISSQVQHGKLLVSIFGHRQGASARLIKIETERSITKPERKYVQEQNLAPGQVVVRRPGRDGYQLKTYEITMENDKEVDRRLISQAIVEPEPEIIAVGPGISTKGQVKK
ncbi:VanW family protein [Desulfotomaculum varum]